MSKRSEKNLHERVDLKINKCKNNCISKRMAARIITMAITIPLAAATYVVTERSGSMAASGSADIYQQRFMEMWDKINDPDNGYFSEKGIPYHSVETLMCEAPDYGHESTSEAFSYWIWLASMYGRFTSDWSKFDQTWVATEKYIIPSFLDQPGMDKYTPEKPAQFAAEWETPDKYPSALSDQVRSGNDPLHAGLVSAYGTDIMYGMHWLLDVDNWYGYGRRGDGRTKPSVMNTYQRGPQESVWETIPHPSWDNFKPGWGGKKGFVDLFVADSAPDKQWRYSIASDADARAIQATYWASKWAKEQGYNVTGSVSKASKLGDYLRYSMFDKYFRVIGGKGKAGPGGTDYDSCHYLLAWYYAWGGGLNGYWSWKIGSSHNHFGYQNPMAAWVMSNQTEFKPKSTTGSNDWAKSFERQLEFYTWLQSDEGAIAGGATNSLNGRYDLFSEDTATFYGMGYEANPVYLDPGSNTWFGFQAWSMQRIAELYYETGNQAAKKLMDKWVGWIKKEVKLSPDGKFEIPSTISWSGQPYTWNGARQENDRLHIKVENYGTDLGITGSLANTLLYYSAATKKWSTYDDSSRLLAKELLDRMWNMYKDEKGLSAPEARADYSKFFDQTVYVPSGWTGTMPNGDIIKPGIKFIDIRSKYKNDPDWKKVEDAYKSGMAPVFNYHRFWAQCDIALALGTYSLLFGNPQVVKPSEKPTTVPTPTPAPVKGLIKIEEYNANPVDIASSIRPRFFVSNVSDSPINLEDIKLRYYYINEGEDIPPEFTCDSASVTNATGFHDFKKWVKYKFSVIEEPSDDADYYMEFGFNSGAGKLEPGESIKIELRWNKPNWPNYYQANDYSYNPTAESPVEWLKTTGYVKNVLEWGKEPDCITPVMPSVTSTLVPSTPGSSSGYTVTGYVSADFSYSQASAPKVKGGFKVEISDGKLSAVTNEDGHFEIKNVPANTNGYSLKISKDGFLARVINNIKVESDKVISAANSPIILWAGDFNTGDPQDGVINMKDIIALAKLFGVTNSDSKYSEEFDLNRDNAINMGDVIIIAKRFNKVSSEY
ncbi:MAG TPA: glycoside hydrolase family 48 protein [Pseudobacteroides sp.]|uniref:glycoside hydrolase family 48 protein n=1 Tax=Pseudobacteroides sp. TaxID=1968840 RepID=UPI002F91CF18